MRKHSGDKPFKCEVEGCDKAYTTAANLRLHHKRHEEKISDEVENLDEQHTSGIAFRLSSCLEPVLHFIRFVPKRSVFHSFVTTQAQLMIQLIQ